MKRYLIAFLLLLSLYSPVSAQDVTVVLQDNTLLKGNLLGTSADLLFVEVQGKAREVKLSDVKEVFDARTNERISLQQPIPQGPPPAPGPEAIAPAVPAQPPATPAPATSPASPAMPAVGDKPPSEFMLGFTGLIGSGNLNYPPCLPQGTGYGGGMVPFDQSYGFGLNFEYTGLDAFHLFADMTFYSSNKQVAQQGGYSTGEWVFEQTGWTSHLIGPFPMNVYYWMETTGIRLGGKYLLLDGPIQPWVGLGAGFYSWRVNFANEDQTQSYGKDSGTAMGLTYLIGVNFKLDKDFMFTLFGDFASPVVHPRVENLFRNGWTWESIGGEGPIPVYRFGASIYFSV